MKRAYKYRFYPTSEQIELVAQTFGCVRFVYTAILRWRIDAGDEREAKIGYIQASARLTAMKKAPELTWLNDVFCVPLQQALCHQQSAFASFFVGRTQYSAYNSKHHRQSTELTVSVFKYRGGNLHTRHSSSCRCVGSPRSPQSLTGVSSWGLAALPLFLQLELFSMAKSKTPLDVRLSRQLPSVPSTVILSKDASGRCFASCGCEFESKPLPVSAKITGVDVGLIEAGGLAVLAPGESVNPQPP